MFYLDLFRALESENVRYVLIGGLALNIHGVERATMDVDIMLAMDHDNLQAFLRAAPTLDILVQSPVDFDGAWARRIEKDLGDVRVSVAHVDDLIKLKSGTGRQSDAADIVALERLKTLGRA